MCYQFVAEYFAEHGVRFVSTVCCDMADNKFDYKQALALVNQKRTCIRQVTSHQHITLNPKFIGAVGKGIREQLVEQLNLYSKKLVK